MHYARRAGSKPSPTYGLPSSQHFLLQCFEKGPLAGRCTFQGACNGTIYFWHFYLSQSRHSNFPLLANSHAHPKWSQVKSLNPPSKILANRSTTSQETQPFVDNSSDSPLSNSSTELSMTLSPPSNLNSIPQTLIPPLLSATCQQRNTNPAKKMSRKEWNLICKQKMKIVKNRPVS